MNAIPTYENTKWNSIRIIEIVNLISNEGNEEMCITLIVA